MLERLKLENYKNFSNLELNELKRVNFIAGQNNIGKTSILESIFLFYDRGAPDVFIKLIALRGIPAVELMPNSLWVPYFNNLDTSKLMRIEVNDSGHINEAIYRHSKSNIQSLSIDNYSSPNYNNMGWNNIQTSQNKSNLSDSLICTYKEGKKPAGEAQFSIDGGQLNLNFKNFNNPNKRVTFVQSSSKGANQADSERLGKIDIEQGLDKIVKYLKIIDASINSLSVVLQGQQPVIYCDAGLKRKIPISFMGEGVSKLLSIIAAILTSQSGIVCIDEIENGIHYSLFPDVMKIIVEAAKENNCQVFVTTHSNDVLKGLYIASKEDSSVEKNISFYRIDKKNDQIKPKHYTSSMLFSAIDRDWEVR